MTDFKESYKDSWSQASDKEHRVKDFIEGHGLKIELCGLGAGSDQRIDTPEDHEPNLPDMKVRDCFIEVTGSLKKIPDDAPLWIRPGKLNKMYQMKKDKIGRAFFVVFPDQGMKVVNLDTMFFTRAFKKDFTIIKRMIRGHEETMVVVPSNDASIIEPTTMIEVIKDRTTRHVRKLDKVYPINGFVCELGPLIERQWKVLSHLKPNNND